MGLIDKFFRPKVEETQVEPKAILLSSFEGPVVNYSFDIKEDPTDKVTYSGIGANKYGTGIPPQIYQDPIDAVRGYPLIYSCVCARSDAVASLGIKVFKTKGGQKEEVSNHDFYDIYKNPNPWQGSFEFLERASQMLDTTGNLFILKVKIAGTYELYVLNSKYVAIIPDPKKKVKEYRYYISGQSMTLKSEEVIHIKFNDVDDEYYGFPPLATAADLVTFEKSRMQFLNTFFSNGAVPSGVLETENNISETQLKKLRGDWMLRHGGIANSHTLAILQGGLKYKVIASPLKDLDFSGLRKLTKDEILTIFRIPESILGAQDSTGANEGTSAITGFWRSTVVPHLKRLESALNRGLKKELFGDGKFYFEFDLTDVPALQDNKKEIATYIQTLISCSVFTPNDGRKLVGLPPLSDGFSDKTYISNSTWGNGLVPVDTLGNAASNTGVGADGTNGKKPVAAPPKQKPKKEFEDE